MEKLPLVMLVRFMVCVALHHCMLSMKHVCNLNVYQHRGDQGVEKEEEKSLKEECKN